MLSVAYGRQLLSLFHGYYIAARTTGLTPAARLSFAEAAAGPMSKLVLAYVECTWHDRGALSGAQAWRCHMFLNRACPWHGEAQAALAAELELLIQCRVRRLGFFCCSVRPPLFMHRATTVGRQGRKDVNTLQTLQQLDVASACGLLLFKQAMQQNLV